MLVGTIMIPALLPRAPGSAVALFVALSILAGGCWTALGAMLPERVRRHSYKGAAVVVAGSLAGAVVSARVLAPATSRGSSSREAPPT